MKKFKIIFINLIDLQSVYQLFLIYLKFGMSDHPNQQELAKAVDAVFNNYDKNQNGLLEVEEVSQLINDALKQMNQNRTVSTK